ncbi:MAG TPA: hypothetical protein VHT05_11860 [Candidatus Elarobacter sp.]|nr:hypothetical protein [Candidatus Elarobacter sp.]
MKSKTAPIAAAAVSSVEVSSADAGRGIMAPVVTAAAAPVAIMNLEKMLAIVYLIDVTA